MKSHNDILYFNTSDINCRLYRKYLKQSFVKMRYAVYMALKRQSYMTSSVRQDMFRLHVAKD